MVVETTRRKIIIAIPSLDLVIVRHGDRVDNGFALQLGRLVADAFAR